MLEMKDICFRYTKNTPIILDHVNLTFDKGEFVAITGRNGSGKTTITRILTGLEKPESGKVLFNGKDVTKEDAARRSRFIGYVFQQPDRQMFMPTVREEIAFGPFHQGKRGEELEEAITKAMEDTDTTAMADEYPRTLSRGDQQRVAIASALAMNTEYLVLDEPTSGQDGREKKRLVSLMESLQKKELPSSLSLMIWISWPETAQESSLLPIKRWLLMIRRTSSSPMPTGLKTGAWPIRLPSFWEDAFPVLPTAGIWNHSVKNF